MDIGTAAYLYALRATLSAPRQTMVLVSVSRVYTADRANVPVCKTPSRFIVRIHEIIPPWYRAIAANIRRYRLLQSRTVSFRQWGQNNIAKFFLVAIFLLAPKWLDKKVFPNFNVNMKNWIQHVFILGKRRLLRRKYITNVLLYFHYISIINRH